MSVYSVIVEETAKNTSWTKENEAAILEPYTYIRSSPSKEVLRHLASAFNDWLHVPDEELELIIGIALALQNDCLLFDDIEDGSELRRGKPVAHSVYGIPHTVNAASYVVILAYKDALSLRKMMEKRLHSATLAVSPEQILTDELLNAHRGQGLDILWRDRVQCPSETQYIGMIKNKTGNFFRLLAKLMQACSTAHSDIDLSPLCNFLGVIYQIRDDYCNLQDGDYSDAKGFAEDLTEGKFSFPLIHAIHADETNTLILDILRERPKTPTLKKRALKYMEETKSFEYTAGVLHVLYEGLGEEITRLGGNPRLVKLMEKLRLP